jgi:DNA-binding GntR family transcriptional regulator
MDGSIRPPSLTEQARAELERLILSGSLVPGERLSEVALAERLGTSRGPVREALRLLERDGLVVTGEAYRGAHVRRLEATELAELYETRALLHGFICARVAERADAALVDALRAQVAAMARAIDSAPRFFRLNLAFHEALLAQAAHARTATIYRGLERESHLARRQAMQPGGNRAQSNAEHAALVEAFAARDTARARALGEAHVLGGKRRWLAALGLG